jgi:hypothetical protein
VYRYSAAAGGGGRADAPGGGGGEPLGRRRVPALVMTRVSCVRSVRVWSVRSVCCSDTQQIVCVRASILTAPGVSAWCAVGRCFDTQKERERERGERAYVWGGCSENAGVISMGHSIFLLPLDNGGGAGGGSGAAYSGAVPVLRTRN